LGRLAKLFECAADVEDARRKSHKDADQKQPGLRAEARIRTRSKERADKKASEEFRPDAKRASERYAPCPTGAALRLLAPAGVIEASGELIERGRILLGAI
jgi:hypothetical protein